ncbi:DUF4244 domain-containing protein [Brachybacterium halotolerans]|uniref:DUF4244 domain-containing protein n=1 Tax=Brachybacterium halotolerans TaxID=2795215 RepID=UPI001FE74B10|nr:DUF4244 domain-containing protein [Brachybacterium halotolerans]
MSALVLTQPVPPRRRSASTRPTPVGPTTTRAASGPPARSHAPRGGTGVFGPTRHRLGAALRDDAGASTAEYAITVLATVARLGHILLTRGATADTDAPRQGQERHHRRLVSSQAAQDAPALCPTTRSCRTAYGIIRSWDGESSLRRSSGTCCRGQLCYLSSRSF